MLEPQEPVADMGIPASSAEMEEKVDDKCFMRAEDHTECAYVQYLSNDSSRTNIGMFFFK